MTLSIISTITRSDNMFGVGYDYTSANFAYKAKISSILNKFIKIILIISYYLINFIKFIILKF